MNDEKINLLVNKIKEDDENAFRELFFILHAPVYRFVYRMVNNAEISKDLAQDVFIRFWNSRNSLDTSQSPVAYIYKIAKNLSLNHIHRTVKLKSIDGSFECKEDSRDSNLFDEYENQALLNDLENVVHKLPERCRMVFILSRYDDMKYNEIADVMETSLQTVKNQMNKALSIIRQHLSAHKD